MDINIDSINVEVLMKPIKINQSSSIILKFVITIGVIASVTNVFTNLFSYKKMPMTISSILIAGICLALYITRRKWMDNGALVTIVFVLISLVVFPTAWFFSHGIQGSIILYSFFLLTILTYVLNEFWGKLIPFLFILTTCFMIWLEYANPDIFSHYNSRQALFTNIMTNYIIVTLFIFALVYAIRKHYESVQKKLMQLANTDDLTKVYNRRYLIEELEKNINKSNRYGNDFSLVFIDINKFKAINDAYGHQIGDEILILVGKCINDHIRNYDTVARYGGDEFVILLPDIAVNEAEYIANRIRIELEQATMKLIAQPVTIAVGIISGKGLNIDEILKVADEKMYQDKKKLAQTHPSTPSNELDPSNKLNSSNV